MKCRRKRSWEVKTCENLNILIPRLLRSTTNRSSFDLVLKTVKRGSNIKKLGRRRVFSTADSAAACPPRGAEAEVVVAGKEGGWKLELPKLLRWDLITLRCV